MKACEHWGCHQKTKYRFCFHHYREYQVARIYLKTGQLPSGTWLCQWCVEDIKASPTEEDWNRLDEDIRREVSAEL